MTFALPGPSALFDEDMLNQMMDDEDEEDSKKFDLLLKTFLSWCCATSPHEITEGFEKITDIVNNLRLNCTKSAEAQESYARQTEIYNEQYAKLEEDIAGLRKVHAVAASQLQQARKIETRKMKYEAIAKIIYQLPDRKETMKQLEEIQVDIDVLESETGILFNKLTEQEKYLSVLLTSAIEMKNKLIEEEPEHKDSYEIPAEEEFQTEVSRKHTK
ncbi:hypothetical protein NPIL_584071 [Nephila pilipes]|uniref:THO complex subunit 7 homolog n=1 Tax=Nephila pilipes TaxID=299642 RepID=A0A8X6MMV9_NEPPI|nr:hypothetical protein NPIL_584071 [Nephila pilipes]